MSRKSNKNRPSGNMNYNRMSSGYQKNLYKQKLKEDGVKAPKSFDPKKIRIAAIVILVIDLIVTIILIMNLKWWGLLIGVGITAVIVAAFYFYMNSKQKEIIRYYKQIGMTEEMYIGELKRRGTDVKQIEAQRKIWRKTKLD